MKYYCPKKEKKLLKTKNSYIKNRIKYMHERCMCATNWIKRKIKWHVKNVCWHLIVYDLNLNAFTQKKENKS